MRRADWAYLTRAGSERDLIDEIGDGASFEAEGVVVSGPRPKGPDGHLRRLAFARQAMHRPETVAPDTGLIAPKLAEKLARVRPRAEEKDWTFALQVVAPDSSDPEDPRRPTAQALEADLGDALPEWAERRAPSSRAVHLLQVWVVESGRTFVGLTPVGVAGSWAPGGRLRLERPEDAPSRSALKLEEAIRWCGSGPEKGDLVADLGAAPGGWSQVAVARGATVIAVDLGRVKIEAPPKRFAYLKENAFRYAPPETLDWVLCDMAYRPLEVAKLLAKWGRRSWARQMLANIKLPMKQKADILQQVLGILEDGGWRGLEARQLYHDRDEVTIFGWLSPGQAHQPAQAPFRLRSDSGRHPKASGRARRGGGPPKAESGRRAAAGRSGTGRRSKPAGRSSAPPRTRSGGKSGSRSGPRKGPRKRR